MSAFALNYTIIQCVGAASEPRPYIDTDKRTLYTVFSDVCIRGREAILISLVWFVSEYFFSSKRKEFFIRVSTINIRREVNSLGGVF